MTAHPSPPIRWFVDKRAGMATVGDQGMRRTCLAWAATAANENRHSERLSVEYLHWACGLPPNRRGTARSLKVAMSTKGQPAESQWSYSEDTDDLDAAYGPPASITGPYHCAITRRIGIDSVSLTQYLSDGYLPIVVFA